MIMVGGLGRNRAARGDGGRPGCYGQDSDSFTADSTTTVSTGTFLPAAGDCEHTCQLLSTSCTRPSPDASCWSTRYEPSACSVSCAYCRFCPTNLGIVNFSTGGAAGGVVLAGAAVLVGAGATGAAVGVAVAVTVDVAVAVDVTDAVAVTWTLLVTTGAAVGVAPLAPPTPTPRTSPVRAAPT